MNIQVEYHNGQHSHTHLHQVLVAVKGRANLITPAHTEELQKYIAGIIRKTKHKLLAISCMPDHTHLFVAMKPDTALSDLVRDVKENPSTFINNKAWVRGQFSRQGGYVTFSYAQSQVRTVTNYILNQEQHHAERRFREEYIKLLKKFEITFEWNFCLEKTIRRHRWPRTPERNHHPTQPECRELPLGALCSKKTMILPLLLLHPLQNLLHLIHDTVHLLHHQRKRLGGGHIHPCLLQEVDGIVRPPGRE
jgi:putative transposase